MLSILQESFWERLVGVVTLKGPTYEATQRDPEATSQSWWIVVLLGLANGIAWILSPPIDTAFPGMTDEMARDVAALAAALTFDTPESRIAALAAGILGTILSWYLSSWLLRVIGNRVSSRHGRRVTAEEMRRLVAWSYSPTLAAFLVPIPVVGLLATLGALWAFVTGVMAVRTAFGVGTLTAIGIEIAAFLCLVVLAAVVLVVLITVMIA